MLIDSHAHLTSDAYSPEVRESLLEQAFSDGVTQLINIGAGYGMEGNKQAVEFAQSHANVYATVGIHPHDASLLDDSILEQLQLLASSPKVVAIGEVGLDYYYNHSEPQIQIQALRKLIQLAHRVALPLSIHVRDAYWELDQVLKEEKGYERGGVIHCFSGDLNFARQMVGQGFYLSFSGIITFKKSEALRQVVAEIPLESILVETDSPYLAPEPYRGKQNQPAWVRLVAEKIAEIKRVPLEKVANITSSNARKLFRLG